MNMRLRFVDLENITNPNEQCRYDIIEGIVYDKKVIGAVHHSCEGKYVFWDNKFYALAFSERGPLFIANQHMYYLQDHEFNFFHSYEGNCKYRFKAIIDGEVVVNVKYPDPGKLLTHPFWGDDVEEGMDFGYWITELSTSKTFLKDEKY